jgi:hypothetical protein
LFNKYHFSFRKSLTDQVIEQHYIDALTEIGKNGNLVVVPEGSTPMVNVPAANTSSGQ